MCFTVEMNQYLTSAAGGAALGVGIQVVNQTLTRAYPQKALVLTALIFSSPAAILYGIASFDPPKWASACLHGAAVFALCCLAARAAVARGRAAMIAAACAAYIVSATVILRD